MKVKYLRLSKEERKKIKKEFYETNLGMYVKKKLTSALICSIFCLIMALYLIIDAFVRDLSLMEKVYGFFILIVGIILIITYRKISVKKINEYLTKKKK